MRYVFFILHDIAVVWVTDFGKAQRISKADNSRRRFVQVLERNADKKTPSY